MGSNLSGGRVGRLATPTLARMPGRVPRSEPVTLGTGTGSSSSLPHRTAAAAGVVCGSAGSLAIHRVNDGGETSRGPVASSSWSG